VNLPLYVTVWRDYVTLYRLAEDPDVQTVDRACGTFHARESSTH